MVATFSDQVLPCFAEAARLRSDMLVCVLACSSWNQTIQQNVVQVLLGTWVVNEIRPSERNLDHVF